MKIIVVSLAFAPARVVIECMKQVYATIGDISFEHHVLMQHYPIDQERNDKLLKTLFESYNCIVHDLGQNVGLSAGYNYLIQQANIQSDDIVIGLDLDCYPETKEWGKAFIDVIQADKTIGWVSLMNPHSKNEIPARGYTTHTIGGHVAYECHQACVNSICAWSGAFLQHFNLKEPNKWYGGLESMSHPTLKQLGFRWVYLPAYEEVYNQKMEADGLYILYKWSLAHLKNTTLDFDSWLKEDPSRLELK